MSKKATLQADGTWVIQDFTTEEETNLQATIADITAIKKAVDDATTKKTTDQAAATTKLKALGLTHDEIIALIN